MMGTNATDRYFLAVSSNPTTHTLAKGLWDWRPVPLPQAHKTDAAMPQHYLEQPETLERCLKAYTPGCYLRHFSARARTSFSETGALISYLKPRGHDGLYQIQRPSSAIKCTATQL